METTANRREILQEILDREDDPWIIMKPSRRNPADPDELCVFQNPARWKEAQVNIPHAWFLNNEIEKIESTVADAIARAEQGYRFTDG
jgi:hypothetical protein